MTLPKEHFILPILEHLQLSVQDLGGYLGMQPANLHHAISGRRDFTREQMQALVTLDSLVDQGAKSELQSGELDSLLNEAQTENLATREERIWSLQMKLRKMQKSLVEMEQTFLAAKKGIGLLNYLSEQSSAFNEQQMVWIKSRLSIVKMKLVRNAPDVQLDARARIAAIEAELHVLMNP